MARILVTNAFKRYISQLYHISKQYPFWDEFSTWPQGAIVWFFNVAYQALSTNTGVEPDTHPDVWEVKPVRTQRWWVRRNSQRLHRGAHQPAYPWGPHHTTYDSERSIAYGNWRVVFLQLARAWQNGSGYINGEPSYGSISIDYTAWNAIAAANLYQVRTYSYWRRNPFQWFMAYNLAAATVTSYNTFNNNPGGDATNPFSWPNFFAGPDFYRLYDNGHPMCFTGTPGATYDPIRITAASIIREPGPFATNVWIQPTPNLGIYNDTGPQQQPVLLLNTGPTVKIGGGVKFQTKSRARPAPFWTLNNDPDPGAYPVFATLLSPTLPTIRDAVLTLRYVRTTAPWQDDGTPIPCGEPGPPFRVRGATSLFYNP